jgi:glucose/mannose-6-phosphate isomerase
VTVLPGAGERLDSIGMWDLTVGLPEQIGDAVALVDDVVDVGALGAGGIERVVVLGVGGSGIAGDVLAAVAGPACPVPISVVKGYRCPAFVDERTLVVAASCSGNTEETVEAATGAHAAGARLVVLAAGGRLGELAGEWGAPWIRLPSDIPMPRAAIGALSVPPIVLLDRLGLLPGGTDQVHAAAAQLARRRDQVVAATGTPADVPKAVARTIGLTMPIVYGGDAIGAVAATRWKNQVNENAKAPAFAHSHPELCHNEICGWGQHGDVTRQVFTLVELRHDHEHPQIAKRFDVIRPLVEEVVADVVEVRAEGEGELAQLFDLVLLGDLASLHLAYDVGIDPGPIPVLEHVKQQVRG